MADEPAHPSSSTSTPAPQPTPPPTQIPPVRKFTKATTFKPEEEIQLIQTLIERAQKGEEVLRQDVIDLVVKVLKSDNRKNTFRNGIPGDKWFSLVRRRHNKYFLVLDPKVLEVLERVGFTEKVTNTVIYSYKKTPTARSEVSIKREPRKRKRKTLSPSWATTPSRPRHVSPCSDESDLEGEGDNDSANQESQPADSSDFNVGNRLEVMDFNDNKWYAVKIVEVDYEEGEVLVHFENWNNKYDEWVRMDSNRIRRPMLQEESTSKKVFVKGEKVIAVWAYNQKYPAVVREVLPKDKYEVLFLDGYAKILRGCKLFKVSEEDLKNIELPPPKKPAPPMGADPVDPNLGPKEERRIKKRKVGVMESYLPQKRQRQDYELSPHSSTPEKSYKSMAKLKGRFSLPMQKKEEKPKDLNKSFGDEDEDDDNYDNYIDEVVEDSGSEDFSEEKGKTKKVRQRRKKSRYFDDSKYQYRPRLKPGVDEDPERWNVELPPEAEPVKIRDNEGHTRLSIVIPDRNLPPGWTKHTMRRRNDSKWDVFLVNADGRKFRSRNELRNYFAELKEPFPENSFDFQVGRKMEMIRSQVFQEKKLSTYSPPKKFSSLATPIRRKKRHSIGTIEGSPAAAAAEGKTKLSTPQSRLVEVETKSSTKPATPPFPLSEMRTPDGGYTCCGKTFRKENLFQMHMKHYHPEYSNLFGSTPNVADLAYARTVGGPIEDSRGEAMSPKSTLSERVTKYETERKLIADTPTTSKGSKNNHPKEAPKSLHNYKKPDYLTAETAAEKSESEPEPVQEEKNKKESSSDDSHQRVEGAELHSEKESTQAAKPSKDEKPLTYEASKPSGVGAPTTEESTSLVTQAGALTSQSQSSSSATTGSMPVIKPLKQTPMTSETMIVQTTTSAKMPITITKCNPKTSTPLTKMTISMTSTTPSAIVTTATIDKQKERDKDKEKEKEELKEKAEKEPTAPKFTIKTLLPMRPPKEPAEAKEPLENQKPKIKEAEVKEETPTKRGRKRTSSETLPKKLKLFKQSTGSLEEKEQAEAVPEAKASPSVKNGIACYRFSRNRSQTHPQVSLEKLNVTPDKHESEKCSLAPEEVKTEKPTTASTTGPGRPRGVNRFKAANKITRRIKDSEAYGAEWSTTYNDSGNTSHLDDSTIENLRKEEIINCTCGYMEEDGLMIQCDLCLCWQHGLCNNIDKEADVPEKYVCSICLNPPRQRASMKYLHNQDWLKEGKLPTLSFRQKNNEEISQKELMLKKSHDLTASLLQLRTTIHSLRVKTHIATKPDHPKLYLWAKSWKNDGSEANSHNEADCKPVDTTGPQPEAAIDETECRLRLLEHVEDYQQQVDNRLTSIQAQIAALEAEDPDLANDESSDHCPVTKQTIQMILRDLMTVKKVVSL